MHHLLIPHIRGHECFMVRVPLLDAPIAEQRYHGAPAVAHGPALSILPVVHGPAVGHEIRHIHIEHILDFENVLHKSFVPHYLLFC